MDFTNKTIGEIVAEDFRTAAIFKKHGIDFCCRGGRTIEELKLIIARYPNVTDYVWAQEEPKNMGAYGYMLMNFDIVKWRLAAANAYSAPAPGSPMRHKARHQEAIDKVFLAI